MWMKRGWLDEEGYNKSKDVQRPFTQEILVSSSSIMVEFQFG